MIFLNYNSLLSNELPSVENLVKARHPTSKTEELGIDYFEPAFWCEETNLNYKQFSKLVFIFTLSLARGKNPRTTRNLSVFFSFYVESRNSSFWPYYLRYCLFCSVRRVFLMVDRCGSDTMHVEDSCSSLRHNFPSGK